ncbi:META domain-containing protein [Neotabrizicola sp. sgz301269]|uniref:META domain-containing protein n=1 Tax=Neotabrizicola sp. sgz301269 TaxID=3276282 RepID=UPI00376FC3EA
MTIKPPAPIALAALLAATACVAPGQAEPLTGTEWHLVGIEGQRAPAPLSLIFAEDGKVTGKAPCNRWFAANGATLPALALQGIGATKMACPDLAVEQAYFEALAAMQRMEQAETHLFLIRAEGRVLEFSAKPEDDLCYSCQG